MSQVTDYTIDNSTGANVRADINAVLAAISTNNSGSSAPSTTFPHGFFANTTDSMLQLRNAANNAFINLRKFDGSCPLPDGTNSAPSLFFDDDTNTGLYSSAADTLNFATGGTERLELGTTTVFNEDGADVDFRIEGNSEANLFYVDASTDRIGIGLSSPLYRTEIAVSDTTAYSVSTTNSTQHQLRINNTGLGGTAGLFFTAEPSSGSAGHAGIRVIAPSSGNAEMTFSVRDGGTYSEKVRIDSAGRLAIGLSDPTRMLHIKSDGVNKSHIALVDNDSNNEVFRVGQQSDGDGFLQLLNDSAEAKISLEATGDSFFMGGRVGIGTSSLGSYNANGDNLVIRSGGNTGLTLSGSTGGTCSIIFSNAEDTHTSAAIDYDQGTNLLRLRAGESDGVITFCTVSSTERARIDSSGNLLVSTTSSTINSANFGIGLFSDHGIAAFKNTDGTGTVARIGGNAGQVNVFGDGDLTNNNNSYGQASDETLKQDIVDAASQWNDIKALRVRKFRFKDNPTGVLQIGVVAQEIETVSAGLVKENSEGIKSVKYSVLYMKAVKCLQEAITKIEVLETKVAALEAA